MATYLEIFLIAGAVLYVLYYYFTMHFDFWKNRGVPGPKPIPLFGNAWRMMIGKLSPAEHVKELYKQYKGEPLVGVIIRRTPVLIVQDPDLIKDVLIKDFGKFTDRTFWRNEIKEPLSAHLFGLEGKRWRPLRAQLTPVFTSGKLKGTFSLILECANQLEEYMDTLVAKGEPIEVREIAAQFTTDVIGSCVFGVDMHSMSEQESDFRRVGKEIFATTLLNIFKHKMKDCCLELYNFSGHFLPHDTVTKFITKLVVDTMNYRKQNNIVRPDFVNTLLELEKNPQKLGDIELTTTLLAAQAFAFFGAGFETSSTTISNALYELALNPEIQDKLREEINEYDTNNGGEWRYETMKEMMYLDKVFKETLRKYPPLATLVRDSTDVYTFKDPKVMIPKKTKIMIPVYALHWDPEVYPNPVKFDPERFDPALTKLRHPMYHLPFGDGPRNCIGARFAVYQTKVGLIKIIRKFRVSPCEKTPSDPYKLNPFSFVLAPTNGLYLKVTRLDE